MAQLSKKTYNNWYVEEHEHILFRQQGIELNPGGRAPRTRGGGPSGNASSSRQYNIKKKSLDDYSFLRAECNLPSIKKIYEVLKKIYGDFEPIFHNYCTEMVRKIARVLEEGVHHSKKGIIQFSASKKEEIKVLLHIYKYHKDGLDPLPNTHFYVNEKQWIQPDLKGSDVIMLKEILPDFLTFKFFTDGKQYDFNIFQEFIKGFKKICDHDKNIATSIYEQLIAKSGLSGKEKLQLKNTKDNLEDSDSKSISKFEEDQVLVQDAFNQLFYILKFIGYGKNFNFKNYAKSDILQTAKCKLAKQKEKFVENETSISFVKTLEEILDTLDFFPSLKDPRTTGYEELHQCVKYYLGCIEGLESQIEKINSSKLMRTYEAYSSHRPEWYMAILELSEYEKRQNFPKENLEYLLSPEKAAENVLQEKAADVLFKAFQKAQNGDLNKKQLALVDEFWGRFNEQDLASDSSVPMEVNGVCIDLDAM